MNDDVKAIEDMLEELVCIYNRYLGIGGAKVSVSALSAFIVTACRNQNDPASALFELFKASADGVYDI